MKSPSATHAPKLSPSHRVPGSMLVICLVAIGAELGRDSSIARGQTIVPPTINSTTWSPAGNPFIITDNSTIPWMSLSNNVPVLLWDAVPRSTYRLQYIMQATDTEWSNLLDLDAVRKRTVASLNATNAEQYLRIQSLGRLPGN